MKRLRWNLGVLIINIGYQVRKHQSKPDKPSVRWGLGRLILKAGYSLRGEIPQKRYTRNS